MRKFPCSPLPHFLLRRHLARTPLALSLALDQLTACGQNPTAGLEHEDATLSDALKASSTLTPVGATNQCLQPENGRLDNGTRVTLVNCDPSKPQKWTVDTNSGSIRMGDAMCLDVSEGADRKGTPLQLWQCADDNKNQRFDLSGNAVRWRDSNKCLGLGGGLRSGAPLQLLVCNSSAASQAWKLPKSATAANGSNDKSSSRPSQAPTAPASSAPVDLGPNVLVFDSGMSMNDIQNKINGVYNKQVGNHFGPERYAYVFKPGRYQLDVKLGFGMTVAGLGASPDDVIVTGSVRAKGDFLPDNNATQNFWRGVENLSVVPTLDNGALVWAISQGTSFRRMHVRGNMNLSDNGWSSGGFVADTKVDGTLDSGTQQQFLTRNTTMGRWNGSNWNMVFVGDKGAPSGDWPNAPYSVVGQTPVIREKPYLAVDSSGAYVVRYPQLKRNSAGVSWDNNNGGDVVVPISKFYIARVDKDNADSINGALDQGMHILFTPGLYQLNKSLHVSRDNTILLGMGIATLRATQGSAVVTVDDVDGVSVSGIVVDAGPTNSESLLVMGRAGARDDHSSNPTALHDVSCRVGGAGAAKTTACLTIHSRDVILDNTWLWRADHGDGADWDANPSRNGIVVNGSDVTAYGLFSEHFQGYQTLWNGENGQTYMYQSEFPYDAPNQWAWQHDGVNGYASYKVADNVTRHKALGMGMYAYFHNNVRTENAIESPNVPNVTPNHLVTVWLGLADGSEVTHMINGWGDAAKSQNRVIRSPW